MKMIYILLFLSFGLQAQYSRVELPKSSFSIQTGFLLGVWGNYEVMIGEQCSWHTEFGTSLQPFGWASDEHPIAYEVSARPRWYYKNVAFRNGSQSKRVTSRYISLQMRYRSRSYFLDKDNYYGSARKIALVPSIGRKKRIGDNFLLETGFGVGYLKIFSEREGWPSDIDRLCFDLRLRFGYDF